jgi:acyl-CoA synthetase (AMP-forming)/AMP-acid ligase II
MHPKRYAASTPDKAAIILAESGEVTTYAELEARSNQTAHLFRSLGLQRGDTVALLIDNCAAFFEAAWAAQRSGLIYTCLSTRSSPSELAYLLNDSEAKVVVASQRLQETVNGALKDHPVIRLLLVGTNNPGLSLEQRRMTFPTGPIPDESSGIDLLYSSGTTGQPKGIEPKLPRDRSIEAPARVTELARTRFGLDQSAIYMSPSPLYHAAPLRWGMAVHRVGGTLILFEKFDAEAALAAIERYRVSVTQWVPTHFVRLLKLDEGIRARYDLSSVRMAIHAAAPCPKPVKEQMIAWWGPILSEYYGGTEGIGMTALDSREWLCKPGSVGRSIAGDLHICDAEGEPVPVGTEGLVYFSGGGDFAYRHDPEKTAECHNRRGWATIGDIGYMDEDGYLFLTDRKGFTIISGGVNIYPQEIENHLITHPQVQDVAVIGAPDEEMGEKVVAVIQPVDWSDAGPGLARELTDYVRSHLSHIKTPRQIDFMRELPRHENGKLYKRVIRDAYSKREAQAA